ncbi:hypothetical protein Hanom_Chr12g01077241 [Helianthus anomalus]
MKRNNKKRIFIQTYIVLLDPIALEETFSLHVRLLCPFPPHTRHDFWIFDNF